MLDNNQSNPDDYSAIADLFLKLRGKGASLSGADLAILAHWKKSQVPASLVEEVLLDLDSELLSQGKTFPTSLQPVKRRLKDRLAALGFGILS